MTDREAFAAIMEIARKDSLPVVPSEWFYCEMGGFWKRSITDGKHETDCVWEKDPSRLDLQAMTGVLGAWLRVTHVLYVIEDHGLFTTERLYGNQTLSLTADTTNATREWYASELTAQLAALRHVTGEK